MSQDADAEKERHEREEALRRYAEVVTQQLQPALARVQSRHAELAGEREAFAALDSQLLLLREASSPSGSSPGGKSGSGDGNGGQLLVNLGCDVFAEATPVDNASRVCVHVGFGFHPELSHEEASAFAKKRIALLDARLKDVALESAQIVARIAGIEEGMVALQHLAQAEALEGR
jgi:prefoldin subunit 5